MKHAFNQQTLCPLTKARMAVVERGLTRDVDAWPSLQQMLHLDGKDQATAGLVLEWENIVVGRGLLID